MMNDPLWKAADVIRAVRGEALHEQTWSAHGVAIDIRSILPGDIFIALHDEDYDGHDFVAAAFSAGASAALVARHPSQVPPDACLVFVTDTMTALLQLARAARERAGGQIVAVAGSIGRTGTKEMLRLALSAVGKTHVNSDYQNNLWTMALALANLPPDADYAVFELAIKFEREQAVLVRPDFAVIATIEAEHEVLFQGMPASSTVILARDHPHFTRLVSASRSRGIKKILSFSREGKADAYLADCALTAEKTTVNAIIRGYNIHYTIGSPGGYLVHNSLAALLTAATVSGKTDECAAALSHFQTKQEPRLSNTAFASQAWDSDEVLSPDALDTWRYTA
jgi:UDP-N-acetylmuramoyl-tripeptide--D-alanyl-D-alanine ligase